MRFSASCCISSVTTSGGGGLAARRDAAEVLLGQRLDLVDVEVADQRGRQIVGRVVRTEVVVGLLLADHPQIRGPTDNRPAVRVGLPEHRVELLVELAGRRRLGAQPALLVHHVALAVELTEHRVGQAIRLHPEPQLQLVGRHGDEVDREVARRTGVHAGGAGVGVDLVELVLDHQRTLLFDELRELLLELDLLFGAGLGVERIVDLAAVASGHAALGRRSRGSLSCSASCVPR